MITAKDLPALVNAMIQLLALVTRIVREDADDPPPNEADRFELYMSFPPIDDPSGHYEEACRKHRERRSQRTGAIARAAIQVRKLLDDPLESNPFPMRLDPSLPLNQRLLLSDVWEELFWGQWHTDAARDKLLTLLGEAIALLTPGGPLLPDGFEWDGHVCYDLTLYEISLLKYMWNGGRRLRCATFEELRQALWDGTDGAFRKAASRCNTKLEESGIFIGLGTEKHCVIATWRK